MFNDRNVLASFHLGPQYTAPIGEAPSNPNLAAKKEVAPVVAAQADATVQSMRQAGAMGADRHIRRALSAPTNVREPAPVVGGGNTASVEAPKVVAVSGQKIPTLQRWQLKHRRLNLILTVGALAAGVSAFYHGDKTAGSVLLAGGGLLFLNHRNILKV